MCRFKNKVLLAILILLLLMLNYVCKNIFFLFNITLNIRNATWNDTGNEKDFSKKILITLLLLNYVSFLEKKKPHPSLILLECPLNQDTVDTLFPINSKNLL